MEAALEALREDVATCSALEQELRGKAAEPKPRAGKARAQPQAGAKARALEDVLGTCVLACKESRKRAREEQQPAQDLSDEALSQYTRFTKHTALKPYEPFLHYVPRLVNVVTLAEALPVAGSGITLPLNLQAIASRCKGAFYAPRRFAAVQLAFSSPRCRVLIFHTGRLVGTGTSGGMAARLAIARAQRQLAEEAGVHLHVRNMNVINQVGAVSLRATLNCDAFATAHSATSHFDRSSFVGLAWRPPNESICCEVYSTGRANLPGSVAERQLIESWSRMLPELLRFSSASHLLQHIPEETQAHHRPQALAPAAAGAQPVRPAGGGLWDGWGQSDPLSSSLLSVLDNPASVEGLNLSAVGL